MTWITNPCNGANWRELPDGKIEVAGVGVPEHSPTSAQGKNFIRMWTAWRPHFEAAAKKYGLPVRWIVAIATLETGGYSTAKQATIMSADGFSSIGIMQPIPMVATMYGYSLQDRFDPAKNIDMGAHLLFDNSKRSSRGLPAIASYYNAGHLCPSQTNLANGCWNPTLNMAGCGNYPFAVIAYNNLGVTLGLGSSSWAGMLGTATLGAGLVALGYFGARRAGLLRNL